PVSVADVVGPGRNSPRRCAPFEGGTPPFGCLVARRHSWLARGRASAFGCLVARRPSWLALGRASAFGSPGAVRCLVRRGRCAVWLACGGSLFGSLGGAPAALAAWAANCSTSRRGRQSGRRCRRAAAMQAGRGGPATARLGRARPALQYG